MVAKPRDGAEDIMGTVGAERRRSLAGARRCAAPLVAIAIALAAGGCATTGSIRGTLALPSADAGRAPVAPGDARPKRPNVRDAVAYVVDNNAPKSPSAPRLERRRVRQTSAGFEPYVIVVPAGTTVVFENHDHVYHNAFSRATAKRFDTGFFAPGHKRSVLFDRAGVVDVYCEIHPQAVGFVVVLPNATYAQPNAHGAFKLPPLAAGTYTVKAWHPSYGETSGRVKVPQKDGAVVRLSF